MPLNWEEIKNRTDTREQVSSAIQSAKPQRLDWGEMKSRKKGEELISKKVSQDSPDLSRPLNLTFQDLITFTANPIPTKILARGVEAGDEFVEWVAKKIEGIVPAGDLGEKPESTAKYIAKRFLPYFTAEAVRFAKPSYLAQAQLFGLGLKGAGAGIKALAPKSVKKGLTKLLKYRGIQPKTYQELAEEIGLKKALGTEESIAVAKTLSTEPFSKRLLSHKEQHIVGKIFRKEAEKIRHLPKYSKYSSIATEGREIMDKWSRSLVKSGIPTKEAKEVINRNVGEYMARMFKTKIGTKTIGYRNKPTRLNLDGLRHRKDLSETTLRKLQVIKEPALPTSIRVKQLSDTVNNAELFNKVAVNPEWATQFPQPGWMQMPNTATMGALKNKWVLPEIADDINGIVKVPEQAFKLYYKMLSAWKFGKVVLNPATHARNMMSNSMLLDFSGTNHFTQARLYPRAMLDYIRKGPLYQRAKRSGAIGGEFVGTEVAKVQNLYLNGQGGNASRWMNVLKMPVTAVKKIGRGAAGIYQGEEQLAKMVKFAHQLEKGMPDKIAAQEAQKWLFNYQKIPKFIDTLRKLPFGAPFITFTYKALPRVAETIANNPLKIYKYYAMFNAFNNASARTLGMSSEELNEEYRNLPEWMQTKLPGIPANLLMPLKDQYNRTQYLNLEYILPVGMAPEIMERGLKGFMGNPLYTLLRDISMNQDFFGNKIVKPGMSVLEQNLARGEHIYRQLAPSFAPNIGAMKGGYSWEKLKKAFAKEGDWLGRVREPEQVLFDVLVGLKVTPVSIQDQRKFKKWEKQGDVREIMRKLKSTLRHKGISDIKKEEAKKISQERIQRILKGQ